MLRLASFPFALAALATLTLAASCGGPNLASQIAKAPEFDPKDQSKCGVTKSQARPLIVEWPSADRAALESQAKRGLVAVRYEGCEMEVLRRCQAPGKYRYTGITRKRDRVTMRDSDELYASIPAYAAKFEGKLETAGQLNVAMTIVGTYEADGAMLHEDELSGECAGATHVVTALTAGAFEFFAGAEAEASAGVEAMGAAAGGKTKSQHETLNQDGDEAACEKATSKDQEPPEGCGALLRVEVVPLGPARSAEEKAKAAAMAAAVTGVNLLVNTVTKDSPPGSPAPQVSSTAGKNGCPADMASLAAGIFKSGDREYTVGAFCMDLGEVTADAYKVCVDKGECSAEGLTCGPEATWGAVGKGNHPINCVNAEQAAAYCAAMERRLPSEEEWEWAARGGERGTAYPWGAEPPAGQPCWGLAGKIGTCPRGASKRADSPEGIHDLVGNVWEWTASGFGGKGGLRVIRGGGFNETKPDLVMSTKRVPNRATDRNVNLGFRCVKSP
ncbi:MAG TPA: SUMF1/EgtB/PvdO family nonheme iron enzyme [Candidatus Nanopelagicales bacterium]|nr:SUMF1/EgtB/PvdO family nonheme iron enzyme [Candidatus Nanopelagicales bacterium]